MGLAHGPRVGQLKAVSGASPLPPHFDVGSPGKQTDKLLMTGSASNLCTTTPSFYENTILYLLNNIFQNESGQMISGFSIV